VTTADGVVTPVGVEQRIETADGTVGTVRCAAVVGVGPAGTQALVAVVVPAGDTRVRPGLADADLAAAVRSAAEVEVAAVLVVPALPVDIRHNSKIDRGRVAAWASRVLAGGRPRSLVRGG
jgi:hypothetical protein